MIAVTADGAQSIPRSNVPFGATVRFTFDERSRELSYDVRITGRRQDVFGVYLHRRVNRPNGGVAHILAKGSSAASGRVTLTEAETADLRAGRLYVSAVSRSDPRQSARADLTI
jgi:hypothetical protein